MRTRLILAMLLGGLGCLAGLGVLVQGEARSSALRLGLVSSLFREAPKSMIEILAQPLKNLMETQAGLSGQFESSAEALTLAKQLHERQVDLAVFHGFEFAWALHKYKDLRPLLLVSNPQPFQAHLVVLDNSKAMTCNDLKGQTLAVPRGSREHVRLFLERRCACGCKEAREFFGKITRPADAEDAFEDLLDGSAQAVLVDYSGLEAYRRGKPENYGKLRVLLKSETFPTGVIAYRRGALSEDILQRLRTGLTAANQTREGRDLLRLCRMGGFETAPADFEQVLQNILKAYPPPPDKTPRAP